MAVFLNTDAAYQDFQMLRNDEFFTDKTGMIEKISRKINTKTGLSASQSRADLEKHQF